MNFHEIAGDKLVPPKRKNLPNRVLRAFDNAMHLEGLARGVKQTLAEICRFIAQDRPFDTVFAHKSTIADRTGSSERTIYRHLALLQEQKLIEVLEQDRKSRNGRFTVARLRLTARAAALLGFIDAGIDGATESDEPLSPTVPTSESIVPPSPVPAEDAPPDCSQENRFDKPELQRPDAPPMANKQLIHRPPSAKMSDGHTLSKPTISKNQPPQRTENGLPIDLAWLTGNGLSRAGIFKLMAKATANRKRLSDVVTVAETYLRDLKGGKLYAYLAKLVDGPTDFSFAAANERGRLHADHQAKILARKAECFRRRFRNTALTNQDQSRLYVIDEQARFVQIFGDRVPSTVPLRDLNQWIERVETGRLVMATLATERRLMR
jgi:DNA-binding transcriptional ArsR family regulator